MSTVVTEDVKTLVRTLDRIEENVRILNEQRLRQAKQLRDIYRLGYNAALNNSTQEDTDRLVRASINVDFGASWKEIDEYEAQQTP